MSRPRPQILTLRYHPDRMAQWREHPEPCASTVPDPVIRFCVDGLWSVLGRPLGSEDQIRLRVSAKQPPLGARAVRLVTLTGGSYCDGSSWREIGGQMPLSNALPRIRALLTRVLGRPPVVGDVVWVEVLQ